MSVTITREHGTDRSGVRVEGSHYGWTWSSLDDIVRLLDGEGRIVTSGTHQPAIVVARNGVHQPIVSGTPELQAVTEDRVSIAYSGVNGTGTIVVSWRFDEHGAWLEPLTYETSDPVDIVRIVYFANNVGGEPVPSLFSSHHVVPGLSMNASMSPIVPSDAHVKLTAGLGTGSADRVGIHQQWGLPSHYFAGYHRNERLGRAHSLTKTLSDAFCCGLTAPPEGDIWLGIDGGHASPIVNVRSDLWGHRRGPGTFTLGAGMVFTVSREYPDAIRDYYRALLATGIIRSKEESATPHKADVTLAPQFNTWGAQMAAGMAPESFDEADLNTLYREFRESGMDARMFVVDDKWEGRYGGLAHDEVRFPNFVATLDRIRADGYLIGLWAAFLRCQDPAVLGLTTDHMLHRPDGTPLMLGSWTARYYVFDFTQPEVAAALRASAQRFIRQYQPDLVKFDFGYEIPSLDVAAPKDMRWAGERLLQKGLEVIVGAMKEVKPDLVVMYYGVSPLLVEHYDLHSTDDMCFNTGEYQLEANRRILFSGLCGEFGMPTYGSSGYDWVSAPSIWFDSAAVGTVGSLNSFSPDENGDTVQPGWIAKYNGVTHAVRPSLTFSIEPLDGNYISAALGATARSWARHEDDKVTLVALRTRWLNTGDGTAAYGETFATNADVIVASRDEQDIEHAASLAVVPFGNGTVQIVTQHVDAPSVAVKEHAMGGEICDFEVPVTNGRFSLPLREQNDQGRPVEWLEVSLHP